MRKWLLFSVVVALISGCSDFGRSSSYRPAYVSAKSTKAKVATAQASAQPKTEDSPYGNSGLLKPGRTEPVIPLDK